MSKRVTITVSDSIYEKIVEMSEESGMTISAVGSMAIMQYFKQDKALDSVGPMIEMFMHIKQLQESSAGQNDEK